jgi:hypothetical protein
MTDELPGFVIEFTYAGDPDEVNDWCFSFGSGHVHPDTGESLFGFYVRFPGTTWSAARIAMHERFGRKWGSQYRLDECVMHADRYGWAELPAAEWPEPRKVGP